MTITLTEEKRRRTEAALTETHRLLAKELTYSSHLQDANLIAFYLQHINRLETILEEGFVTV